MESYRARKSIAVRMPVQAGPALSREVSQGMQGILTDCQEIPVWGSAGPRFGPDAA
jgi:hypothetical protein